MVQERVCEPMCSKQLCVCALLQKENREKSETIDELRLLLIESKKKVNELEKTVKREHEDNEFLIDSDLDF